MFTDSIATSERVCVGLRHAGLRVASLHSGHNHNERADHLRRFADGYLDAVVAPRVLDEGVDVPEADLAIIVAGSNTRRQMVQRMGRVLRRKADGRLARLGVLYLEHTTEDPSNGAHEVFLGEVLGVAEDYKRFKQSDVGAANDFLADSTPLASTRAPRRFGEPPRVVVGATDDALPAYEVLALPEPAARRRRGGTPRHTAPVSETTADDRSRVRTAYRSAHRFISRTEAWEFEEALEGLLRTFGVDLLVASVVASPSVSEIVAKAQSRLEFDQRIAGSLEKAKSRKPPKGRGGANGARSGKSKASKTGRAQSAGASKKSRRRHPVLRGVSKSGRGTSRRAAPSGAAHRAAHQRRRAVADEH